MVGLSSRNLFATCLLEPIRLAYLTKARFQHGGQQATAQRIGFVADVEAVPAAGRCQVQDRISGMSSSFAVM